MEAEQLAEQPVSEEKLGEQAEERVDGVFRRGQGVQAQDRGVDYAG
jgi:hypothetical protein